MSNGNSREDNCRELQLELIRVRAEAAAARLDARAAEIERLLLARAGTSGAKEAAGFCSSGNALGEDWNDRPLSDHHRSDAADALVAAIRELVSGERTGSLDVSSADVDGQTTSDTTGGWQARLEGLRRRTYETVNQRLPEPASPDSDSLEAPSVQPSGADEQRNIAADPVAASDVAVSSSEPAGGAVGDPVAPIEVGPTEVGPIEIVTDDLVAGRMMAEPIDFSLADIELPEAENAEPTPRRLRPTGWLASTLAHIAVLVLLGLMTLSAQKPRDQMAFSASASDASEDVIETFTIETSEAAPEDTQPQPQETALEISPVGLMQVAELSLDLPPAPPTPIAADLLTSQASSLSSLAQASLTGDTPSKVQFAGVAGGGNHFVYLVDSSNSMRNFNEARTELLRSIDSLQAHQRFYVVFYDQDPDYMRLANPNTDEPTSLLATPANKLALRRWAMTIHQQRGKSPIDVLPFAFKLRPDVIFLLSDGEFSAKTEEVIREHNRRENLFGEQGPISIIHTIRYPGYSAAEARNAEVQMKRIAQENGGQYRNVMIK